MTKLSPPIEIPDRNGMMTPVHDMLGWETLQPDAILREGDCWAFVAWDENTPIDFRRAAIPRVDNHMCQHATVTDIGETVGSRQAHPNSPGWWPYRLVSEPIARVIEERYDSWLDGEAGESASSRKHEYHVDILPLP
jgi:hypothetical protein